jgi:hypothetical protein
VAASVKSVFSQLRAVLFYTSARGWNQSEERRWQGLMKLGEEDIVVIDRTNLFHNFIAPSHHFFYLFLFRLFCIKLDKLSVIFITANVLDLE